MTVEIELESLSLDLLLLLDEVLDGLDLVVGIDLYGDGLAEDLVGDGDLRIVSDDNITTLDGRLLDLLGVYKGYVSFFEYVTRLEALGSELISDGLDLVVGINGESFVLS